MPEPKYENNRFTVTDNRNKPLILLSKPIAISIGIFHNQILVDLSEEEEPYVEGKATYIIYENNMIGNSHEEFYNIGIDSETQKKIIDVVMNEHSSIRNSLSWN